MSKRRKQPFVAMDSSPMALTSIMSASMSRYEIWGPLWFLKDLLMRKVENSDFWDI